MVDRNTDPHVLRWAEDAASDTSSGAAKNNTRAFFTFMAASSFGAIDQGWHSLQCRLSAAFDRNRYQWKTQLVAVRSQVLGQPTSTRSALPHTRIAFCVASDYDRMRVEIRPIPLIKPPQGTARMTSVVRQSTRSSMADGACYSPRSRASTQALVFVISRAFGLDVLDDAVQRAVELAEPGDQQRVVHLAAAGAGQGPRSGPLGLSFMSLKWTRWMRSPSSRNRRRISSSRWG